MHEFLAENIAVVRSEKVICTVRIGDRRVKAFQVLFGKDGSLYITFPYFRHRIGILSAPTIPANGKMTNQVNLEFDGKVTSHLVKYSHHPDGRAHFSQHGKIFTAIKRQSVALATQHGHLFSLLVQGLHSLDPADPVKDVNKRPKKEVIDFVVAPTDSVKFVGRWLDMQKLFPIPTPPNIGPLLTLEKPDGTTNQGCMVGNPYTNPRHILVLTCEIIPSLGLEPETFCFYGGFDPPHITNDLNAETGMLAFLYPIDNETQLRERIGTVDYVPRNPNNK